MHHVVSWRKVVRNMLNYDILMFTFTLKTFFQLIWNLTESSELKNVNSVTCSPTSNVQTHSSKKNDNKQTKLTCFISDQSQYMNSHGCPVLSETAGKVFFCYLNIHQNAQNIPFIRPIKIQQLSHYIVSKSNGYSICKAYCEKHRRSSQP